MITNSLLLGFFYNDYNKSIVQKLIAFVISAFANVIRESSLFMFLKRDSNLGGTYERSIFFKVLNFILSILLLILNPIFGYIEKIYEESLFCFLISLVIKRFDIIIASVLFIIMIVPDKSWYNVYSLIMAVCIYSVYIIRCVIFKHNGIDLKRIDFTFMLFFLVVILATITSIDFSHSVRFFLFYLTCFLMMIVITSYTRSEITLKTIINGFLAGTFIISVFGLLQVVTNSVPFDPSLTDVETNYGMPGRIYSTMANPNNFAEILIMAFPFSIAMLLSADTIIKRMLHVVYSATILAALLFTGSRSGWVAFMFAVFIMFLLKKPGWIPVLLLAGVVSIPFLPEFLIKRLMTLGNVAADSSTMYRTKIFNTVLPLIRDFWATGIGLGTDVFVKIVPRYFLYTYKVPPHTHIVYTQILIETGILGLLTFVWAMLKSIKNASILVFRTNDEFLSNILIASVASLSAILLVSFVEYVWYYPRVMLIFWLVVSIMATGISLARAKKIRST